MGQIVIVPKYSKVGQGFSVKEKMEGWEHPGRRTDGSQSAASWIIDELVTRKATVILCSFCRPKFNPRRHNYRKFYVPDSTGMTDGYQTNGKCDACKQMTVNCGGGTAFVHEETYNLVCVDPIDARRQARAKARALSAWQHIQKQRRRA